MIDTNRQVPSPSASAWAIDLTVRGGPVFVVLRLDEGGARAALVGHLVEIGTVSDEAAARSAVEGADAEAVAVAW